MIAIELLAVAALAGAPLRSASPPAATGLLAGDDFKEAEMRFVRAVQTGSGEERREALDALVALADPAASAVLAVEFRRTSEAFHQVSAELDRLRFALERRQVVLENLETLAEREPSVKKLLPREEKAIAELSADVRKAEERAGELGPWRAALARGMAALFEAIPAAKRKKSEEALWQDARGHPDHGLRLASIELLGWVGSPGAAVQMAKIVTEASDAVPRYRERLAKEMSEVRKLERRMQAEGELTGGRLSDASRAQYDRTKKDAEELRREIFRLQRTAEAAARAGGSALSRETGGDLEKSLQELLRSLKRSKDEARLNVLLLIASAPSEEVRERQRALLAAETEPLARAELIDSLASLGDGGAVPELLERHLVDPSWHVRSRAAAALAALRSREAIPVLIERLAAEEGRVRTDVNAALASLTGQDFRGNLELWRRWWKDAGEGFQVPPAPERKSAALEARESRGVTFFGITTESQRVLFVLDLSGSMAFAMVPKSNPDDDPGRPYDMPGEGEVSRLEVARRDLLKALGGIADGGVFNLVLYATDVWTWSDDLVTMSPAARAEVIAYVDGLKAVGATNIYGALERALDLAGARGGGQWTEPAVDTIYFLSDGRASIGLTSGTEEILEFVRERNRSAGIVIHAIGLSAAQDAALLRRLAEENGGTYVAR